VRLLEAALIRAIRNLSWEYRRPANQGEIRVDRGYGMAHSKGAARLAAPSSWSELPRYKERKRAEERQLLLMRELNHRTKNLLSVVQSIAKPDLASTFRFA